MKIIWYIVGGILIIVATYGYYRFDFYVWQLKHPTAPPWTYLWNN